MWLPESLEHLESVIERGELTESESLEAKVAITSTERIARVVAALANYGGALLIGVDEDENHRVTAPHRSY